MRRYLDYGRRLKSGQGMEELYQWIGRILHDDGLVYSLEEKALAFEIGACEKVADVLPMLEEAQAEVLVVSGRVDRLFLYGQILDAGGFWPRRAAFFDLYTTAYKKHGSWLRDCASARSEGALFAHSSSAALFARFLEGVVQAQSPAAAGDAALEQLREQVGRREKEIEALKEDLEFAEDRGHRAHQRLKQVDDELSQLKKQLREERENGEKLRLERRDRIRSQRQSTQAQRELEHLQREYVKLDRRLQDMAGRLAAFQNQRQDGLHVDLERLRELDAAQILGIGQPVGEEELGQVRRRFASVFHPDRVRLMPPWVGKLFEEVLGLVNEACDRARKRK